MHTVVTHVLCSSYRWVTVGCYNQMGRVIDGVGGLQLCRVTDGSSYRWVEL